MSICRLDIRKAIIKTAIEPHVDGRYSYKVNDDAEIEIGAIVKGKRVTRPVALKVAQSLSKKINKDDSINTFIYGRIKSVDNQSPVTVAINVHPDYIESEFNKLSEGEKNNVEVDLSREEEEFKDEYGNEWYNVNIDEKSKNIIQFQLDTQKNINSSIEELDTFLLDFLKGFNVKTKEFENLKERLGVNALGATDVLNKLIWYAKNRNEETIPEEAAHMLVMLMGETHQDVRELLKNITNWEGYKNVYDEYIDVYKDEEKVKVEAVGKLIAKTLVARYKETGLNKTMLDKALKGIRNFIESILEGLNLSSVFYYNQSVADHIAINVLSGNKDYIFKITNTNKNLNAEKEINENPLAKDIINKFSSPSVKLTGSLAIAGTENIRREEGQGIHDIDFKVENFDVYEKYILPKIPENAVPAHYGWHKKSYSTFAFLIPKEGYTINVLSRKDGFSNGWVTNFEVINSEGKQVRNSQAVVTGVDFFVYKEGYSQKDFDFDTEYIPASLVYEGKMSLGGRSNPYFFSRAKDQEDYVLRNPKSFIPFENSTYYQLDNSITKEQNKNINDLKSVTPEYNQFSNEDIQYAIEQLFIQQVLENIDEDLYFSVIKELENKNIIDKKC